MHSPSGAPNRDFARVILAQLRFAQQHLGVALGSPHECPTWTSKTAQYASNTALKSAPGRPNMAPRRTRSSPIWPQDGFNMAPRRPQYGPNTAQCGPKTAQYGPKQWRGQAMPAANVSHRSHLVFQGV
eukprot:5056917-Pyramimonas_sp.AAC.1